MVTAGESDTAFDIAVYTTLYDRPMPGNGGMISAEMLSAGTARVLVNTTETEVMNEQARIEVHQYTPAYRNPSHNPKPSSVKLRQ